MKQYLLLITSFLVLITFHSCNKPTIIPPPTPTSTLHDSLNFKYINAGQEFSISGASGGDFVTAAGVKFHIPYYSFRNEDGDTIFGTVKVHLFESLDPSDMILKNRATTTNNEILITDGMLRVDYTVNNHPILLGDSVIYIKMPVDIPNSSMLLYDGTEDATGYVDWSAALTEDGDVREIIITTENNSGLIQSYDSIAVDSTNSNWISFSRINNNFNDKTALTINLPEGHDNSNTFFFVHFNDFNSIMPGYFDGNKFVTPATIPAGTNATLVLISEIDGNYYSKFITDLVVGSGYTTSLALDPTTYPDIINTIINL